MKTCLQYINKGYYCHQKNFKVLWTVIEIIPNYYCEEKTPHTSFHSMLCTLLFSQTSFIDCGQFSTVLLSILGSLLNKYYNFKGCHILGGIICYDKEWVSLWWWCVCIYNCDSAAQHSAINIAKIWKCPILSCVWDMRHVILVLISKLCLADNTHTVEIWIFSYCVQLNSSRG